MSLETTAVPAQSLTWSLDLRARMSAQLPGDREFDPAAFRRQFDPSRDSLTFHRLGLPSLSEVSVSAELAHEHPLKHFILQTEPFSSRQIAELLRTRHIDLSIQGFHTGVVTAALCSNPNTGDVRAYHRNAWERDEAIIGLALNRAGHYDQAGALFRSMWGYLGCSDHRGVITCFHVDSNKPYDRFRYGDGMDSPHTKFSVDGEGKRVKCSHAWGMQQLDAKGAGLFGTYRVANQREFAPQPGYDFDLRQLDPMPQIGESIICATWKFLNRIRAWETEDYGPWERFKAYQRATSVGMIAAAAKEAVTYHERMGWGYLPSLYGYEDNGSNFKRELTDLRARCNEVLDVRIPPVGQAVECDRIPCDSAMALLLYPFTPDLSRDQEHTILRTVYRNMGPAGFRRFEMDLEEKLPDGFVGMNYHRNKDPRAYGEFADNSAPGYKAAEWSLFDPLLAGYWYRRYIDSKGAEPESLLYADRHLKRCLSFVTKQVEDLFIEGKNEHFLIRPGTLPEAKAWDTVEGRWRNNHNDLLMARAALGLAFQRAAEATKLWEERLRIESAA